MSNDTQTLSFGEFQNTELYESVQEMAHDVYRNHKLVMQTLREQCVIEEHETFDFTEKGDIILRNKGKHEL